MTPEDKQCNLVFAAIGIPALMGGWQKWLELRKIAKEQKEKEKER